MRIRQTHCGLGNLRTPCSPDPDMDLMVVKINWVDGCIVTDKVTTEEIEAIERLSRKHFSFDASHNAFKINDTWFTTKQDDIPVAWITWNRSTPDHIFFSTPELFKFGWYEIIELGDLSYKFKPTVVYNI